MLPSLISLQFNQQVIAMLTCTCEWLWMIPIMALIVFTGWCISQTIDAHDDDEVIGEEEFDADDSLYD